MSIIEERRTEIRAQEIIYQIAVATRTDEDRAEPNTRVMITLEAGGPEGEPVAEGSLDLDVAVAATVADLVADGLLSATTGAGRSSRRRSAARAAQQGRPWNDEMDAELESRWLAGESVTEIAAYFERTPGGIRSRLPRVGCDPENPGCYLPVPPSRRVDLDGGEPG
ncbi:MULTISPECIES: helix-turn-helix domain containing protein [unclassified Amycolatopsis]|uniref:helix-turn-helix domain containing protein n=1 Tax=unclassified Amycolatopsis TaxID=2618356 RepID=UPI001FF6DB90|nr:MULTISPECIES: helix-turn-helix domain containing protein [unclassified Amycolatopsis]UOZ05926.1 helix-turn-helix domain containing protein [Amycolatopsis sp. WQ 127309]WSJ81513.1 helix-turn-helix domain containing protein [Amycolatopsis sp. NBC_01307]WSK75104.1 helix-turn-helix domain containing protein [Amycolatopsis sp. NBC_01286]